MEEQPLDDDDDAFLTAGNDEEHDQGLFQFPRT